MDREELTKEPRKIPIALTIAGSDSGGGAGIQADLKTFAALGAHGMSAITAVTAQNTTEVRSIFGIPPRIVRDQIDAVASDIGFNAAKTGMLHSPEIILSVAETLEAHQVSQLVVDPVMVATSGARLIEEEAVEALKQRLLPLALIVTPNLPEAEKLVGRRLEGDEEIWNAAREILAMGPRTVVIKGGHQADPNRSRDYFLDDSGPMLLEAPRIATPNTHGSGCTFSAAITALLARELPPREACRRAKHYVSGALRNSLSIGHGHGPLGHFWEYW